MNQMMFWQKNVESDNVALHPVGGEPSLRRDVDILGAIYMVLFMASSSPIHVLILLGNS